MWTGSEDAVVLERVLMSMPSFFIWSMISVIKEESVLPYLCSTVVERSMNKVWWVVIFGFPNKCRSVFSSPKGKPTDQLLKGEGFAPWGMQKTGHRESQNTGSVLMGAWDRDGASKTGSTEARLPWPTLEGEGCLSTSHFSSGHLGSGEGLQSEAVEIKSLYPGIV